MDDKNLVPKKYESLIAEVNSELRKHGARKSNTRNAMLLALITSQTPMSANDIMDSKFVKELSPNKSTVYREIETLVQHEIIREISLLEDHKRYVFNSEEHYHHIVCTECKRIEKVEMHNDLDLVESQIEKMTKFKISNHSLEFFGLCEDCK